MSAQAYVTKGKSKKGPFKALANDTPLQITITPPSTLSHACEKTVWEKPVMYVSPKRPAAPFMSIQGI